MTEEFTKEYIAGYEDAVSAINQTINHSISNRMNEQGVVYINDSIEVIDEIMYDLSMQKIKIEEMKGKDKSDEEYYDLSKIIFIDFDQKN